MIGKNPATLWLYISTEFVDELALNLKKEEARQGIWRTISKGLKPRRGSGGIRSLLSILCYSTNITATSKGTRLEGFFFFTDEHYITRATISAICLIGGDLGAR